MGFIWASGFLEFFLLFIGIYQMRTESESHWILLSDRFLSVFIFTSAETLVITKQIFIVENPPGTLLISLVGVFPAFEQALFGTLFAVLALISIARAVFTIRAIIKAQKAGVLI